MADIERAARWAERLLADLVLSAPVLLDWEMISRVQQFNSAHGQPITLTIGGVSLGLSNTGVGYTNAQGAQLSLPSPIQILQAYLAGSGNPPGHEVILITVSPTTVSLSAGTGFTVNLSVTGLGPTPLGPFVLASVATGQVLLLPALTNTSGPNSVTASASVFSAGTTFNLEVIDQSTGVTSNSVLMTFTT